MEYNKIQFGTLVLIDLTNDTITPTDVASGVTFHSNDGTIKKGVVPLVNSGSIKTIGTSYISTNNSSFIDINMMSSLYKNGSKIRLNKGDYLGDAVANYVPSKYTFSSKNGLKLQGKLDYTANNADRKINADFFLDNYNEDNFAVSVYIPSNAGFAMLGNNNLYLLIPRSNFGDATPEDVRKGKTFVSSKGIQTGTAEF